MSTPHPPDPRFLTSVFRRQLLPPHPCRRLRYPGEPGSVREGPDLRDRLPSCFSTGSNTLWHDRPPTATIPGGSEGKQQDRPWRAHPALRAGALRSPTPAHFREATPAPTSRTPSPPTMPVASPHRPRRRDGPLRAAARVLCCSQCPCLRRNAIVPSEANSACQEQRACRCTKRCQRIANRPAIRDTARRATERSSKLQIF